jgi:hypothetical protein
MAAGWKDGRPCSEAEEEQGRHRWKRSRGGGVADDGEEEAAGEKERRGRRRGFGRRLWEILPLLPTV